MENSACPTATRYRYSYLTDEAAARARTDEVLQDLVLAVVHAAADYDMYATGKSCPDGADYTSSYYYFLELVKKLGIPPQAIIDVIDGCFPDDDRDNLTERGSGQVHGKCGNTSSDTYPTSSLCGYDRLSRVAPADNAKAIETERKI